MECKIKDVRGFGLVESIVVIIIVAVLILVAVGVKKSTFRKAAIKEGMQLIENIDVQTRIYRAQNGTFPTTSRVGSSSKINVSAVKNEYFKEFDLSYASGNNFTVNVYGSGMANGVTLRAVINATTSSKQNLPQGQVEIYGL
ncbi:MAG: prepilin-type N-terminal cleavage/methylation domain-containing protein [Endomicrobiaceae bacterium]|nr:prepilin-type N-terminal cleavage/methylation domain-containing protein [Endomicrobiaceae bacterium]